MLLSSVGLFRWEEIRRDLSYNVWRITSVGSEREICSTGGRCFGFVLLRVQRIKWCPQFLESKSKLRQREKNLSKRNSVGWGVQTSEKIIKHMQEKNSQYQGLVRLRKGESVMNSRKSWRRKNSLGWSGLLITGDLSLLLLEEMEVLRVRILVVFRKFIK